MRLMTRGFLAAALVAGIAAGPAEAATKKKSQARAPRRLPPSIRHPTAPWSGSTG